MARVYAEARSSFLLGFRNLVTMYIKSRCGFTTLRETTISRQS
jgi:hypothetical protein